MCHLRHRLTIFLSRRNIMYHSQAIQVSVFLTIPWFTKSLTSLLLVHETVYFWIYLLNHSKLGQLIDINRTTIFRNLLNNLDEWGWVPGSFQFSNLLQLLNNRLCQDSSVAFFWKSEWGAIRNSKFQLLKVALFRYIAIFIKS